MKKQDGQLKPMLERINKSQIIKNDAVDVSVFIDQCLARLDALSPTRTSVFQIGDRILKHVVYGEMLSEFMFPAIAHLELNGTENPDLTVYSVDGETLGINLPRPFWSWSDLDAQGYLPSMKSDNTTLQYDAYTATFRLIDRTRKIGFHWVLNSKKVPYWERSFPLRSMINWWCRDTSQQPIHAAAVSVNGRGALLTAKGGSGKSTTALNCLMNGMDYLGDDFVLVDAENAKAYSLYNVVKLKLPDFERFPALKPSDLSGHPSDQDKVQVFLKDGFPSQLVQATQLKCVFVTRIVDEAVTTVSDISYEEVMHALATSTLYLLKGESNEAFNKMSKLVKSLPLYYLNLGRDFITSPDVIKEIIANL